MGEPAIQDKVPTTTTLWKSIVSDDNEALLRGVLGIYCVSVTPVQAVVGGVFARFAPGLVQTVSDTSDTYILNKIWYSMPPIAKVGAAAVGAGLYYSGSSVALMALYLPASIISAKVGAEMVLRNINR